MPVVVGIAGSLRKKSLNAALLRVAADLAPDDLTVDFGSIRDIPLYDGDLEEDRGAPDSVTSLKEKIAGANGLLLVTPEYNNAMPGVLKNAIDWVSRPGSDIPRVFGGKPVAVIGASPGPGGTRLAQTSWLPVLRILGLRPWFDRTLYLGGAKTLFDPSGNLTDEAAREKVREFMAGFAAFVRSQR